MYLPYGYDSSKQYNIFYFMHGMGDSENSLFYNDNGEMQRVFDNMIQNGDIEPMIVVTPTFNKFSSDTFYNADHFYQEFRESVVPFAEGKYSTYAKSTSAADIKPNEYYMMSATGTSDFAVDPLKSQIESMEQLDQFRYTSDFSEGNFWFILADGGTHSWDYVRQYLYNGLPFFFR